MRRIGIIGLGIMGLRAARLFKEQGFDVHGFDPFPQAVARAEEAKIVMHASPADVAERTDVALLFVPGPADTENVVAGKAGLLEKAVPGYAIANCSTVDPATNIALGEKALRQGVGYLDAPLLGRPAGIGSWAFVVGGEEVTLRALTPYLLVLCGSQSRILHMGDLGNGNKTKLLNNLLFGAINACTAEIMALAKHMGLSQKLLYEAAVAAGAGTMSNLYKELAPRIFENRYDDPNFTVDMLLKDNQLALDMAKKAGAPLVLGSAVDVLNRMASAQGLGREDTSAMWKMLATVWRSPAQ